MLDKQQEEKLKDYLTQVKDGDTPDTTYHLAGGLGITVDELFLYIRKDADAELKKLFTIYINFLKEKYLGIGVGIKNTQLILRLLEDAGILKSEDAGDSDLELIIQINGEEFKD